MAKTRAEREAQFRAEHGVSSGTYYAMRRKAASAGISPKTFDAVQQSAGYTDAKRIAQTAREGRYRNDKGETVYRHENVEQARYTAAIHTGLIPADTAFSDFDTALDFADIPDDYDWWYH